MFQRLYEYLSNYDKFDPVTYDGFLALPRTKILMNYYENNPYYAALGILYDAGKFTKDDIVKIGSLIKGWKSKIKTIVNSIVNNPSPDNFIELSKNILDVAIKEFYPFGESPTDVPRYVTNVYLENAPETMLSEINSYVNLTGSKISPSNTYEIMKYAIDNTKNNIEEQKNQWLNLTPLEFFIKCVKNPGLFNELTTINDDVFKQAMQSKFTEGQLEYLKTNLSGSFKEHTLEDLSYMDRMECGADDDPLDYAKCGLYEDPINYQNIYNQQWRSTVMGDIIREGLKNTVENTESIMESTNTEHNSDPVISKPTISDPVSSNLWKILGLAGGTALLGGASYAAYRWWQLKKQQEELQKQLQQSNQNKSEEQTKNKSRQRKTVINNIVYTKPQQDSDYNV